MKKLTELTDNFKRTLKLRNAAMDDNNFSARDTLNNDLRKYGNEISAHIAAQGIDVAVASNMMKIR